MTPNNKTLQSRLHHAHRSVITLDYCTRRKMSFTASCKAHKTCKVAAHPLALALFGVAKPKKSDIKRICSVLEDAFTAMRQSVATIGHWAVLGGAVDVAKAIERQGVVKGFIGHIQLTEQALASIYTRCNQPGAWRTTVLQFDEMDALDAFIWLHKLQLEQLSNAEYLQSCTKAANQINGGGESRAIVVEDIACFSVGLEA